MGCCFFEFLRGDDLVFEELFAFGEMRRTAHAGKVERDGSAWNHYRITKQHTESLGLAAE